MVQQSRRETRTPEPDFTDTTLPGRRCWGTACSLVCSAVAFLAPGSFNVVSAGPEGGSSASPPVRPGPCRAPVPPCDPRSSGGTIPCP